MVDDRRRSDGRRQNRPPENGKIQPGERRNPWGRAGKPALLPPNTVDEILLQEAQRIVGHDENGPIDIMRRLIQQDYVKALRDRDNAATARTLTGLYRARDRENQQRIRDAERVHEMLEWLFEAKARVREKFDFAKAQGLQPPDIVPHPDHVVLDGENLHFTGPLDRETRALWEHRKALMRVIACRNAIELAEYKRTGDPAVLDQLRNTEKFGDCVVYKPN